MVAVLVASATVAPLAAVEPVGSETGRRTGFRLLSEADRRGLVADLEGPAPFSDEQLPGIGDTAAGPSFAPESASPIRRIGVDLVALVRAPVEFDRHDWGRAALAVAAVAGVALLDDPIRESIQSGGPSERRFAERIRPLGQEVGLGLMALAWSGGEVTNRPNLSAMGQDGIEAAILAAGIVTPALKQIVGRARPRSGLGSRTFSGSESFPSGETTQAFALAAVISSHSSSRVVDTLAWSTAGLIAWERMRLDAHWASDVVAGALIGTTIGRWVVRRHHPEALSGPDFAWSPLVDRGTYGLSLRWRF